VKVKVGSESESGKWEVGSGSESESGRIIIRRRLLLFIDKEEEYGKF